ncbi:hypothetical protein [Oscillatoria sp. HE19RPO]|uniref:hypothetical protein n=1 Tax=Oscillatoria sp. HE19RPO TaxID=2954806 RepID=UPI0020C2D0A3|nr:hypothetical protein [Oscillatoria sp. HE19RPO]
MFTRDSSQWFALRLNRSASKTAIAAVTRVQANFSHSPLRIEDELSIDLTRTPLGTG